MGLVPLLKFPELTTKVPVGSASAQGEWKAGLLLPGQRANLDR